VILAKLAVGEEFCRLWETSLLFFLLFLLFLSLPFLLLTSFSPLLSTLLVTALSLFPSSHELTFPLPLALLSL